MTTTATQQKGGAAPARRKRALHLLDVENLCGLGAPSIIEVGAALDHYRATMPVHEGDHVVLAASSGPTALAAGLAWPEARLVLRRGPDGADRAILAAVEPGHVAARYGRVVLASGDHIFAGLVERLAASGAAVDVVAPTGSLSGALRRTPACIRHFALPGRSRASTRPPRRDPTVPRTATGPARPPRRARVAGGAR